MTLAAGCGGDKADFVVRNAHIVAMDGRGTTAQAMAVKDGRILALGKEQEMLNDHLGFLQQGHAPVGRRGLDFYRNSRP